MLLMAASESLRDNGFRVLTARNAPAALEILDKEQSIDILFTDVVMPGGMNGVELALNVRRQRPEISILLTSGYTRSALDSVDDELPLLPKPYFPSRLPARFAELARHER